MTAEPRHLDSGIAAEVTARWRAADPLLPGAGGPWTGCGAELAVAGPDGAAAGFCEHWVGQPGDLNRSWGAARQFRLTPRVTGPDVAAPLDALLTRWREHLAADPTALEEDTAAQVSWPSRDITGVNTLLRHGLAPDAVIAARTPGRPLSTPGDPAAPGPAGQRSAGPNSGPRIRRAGPADTNTVARLGLEVIRYDAHFSAVTEREDSLAALHTAAASLLAAPRPWAWLAERDGRPAGLLLAEPPGAATWIAPLTAASPIAYLMLMVVLPGERGTGTGTRLVAEYHREADAAGVAATLLHYGQVNPLSAPFWSQQGYRPLWTVWEARPAWTLR